MTTAVKTQAATGYPTPQKPRGSGAGSAPPTNADRVTRPAPGPAVRAPKRRRLHIPAAEQTVTSLTLSRDLHERAMIAALRLNWSFAELARQALGAWLDTHEPPARPRRPER
jgi:hypothetical protein